ncbi:outer membrane protein assembly factor BamE (lipoprotein component of BamABCDE complex) [Cupriavidus plantarum]|uniref:Outer membrane protein assembly factor BamE (Lipoprotein component of BamABCDE complex) n=2 Tax=Cupriavidus plantarum TaxID=942865 RepID=A0A316FLZ5_9BURK|nr:outer membrane protein assembly factor BamE (lipoprotein component of BamABCDE complex) [Cupriavidus plantarum]
MGRCRRMFVAVALSATLGLTGCATAGSGKINWNNARQVKDGMTKKEVAALMGDPYQVVARNDGTQRYVWVHVNLFSGTQSAALEFDKDGKVVKAFQIPDNF